VVWVAASSFDANAVRVGSVLILVVAGCLAVAYIQIRRLYRCPRCNRVPTRIAFGWGDEFGSEPRDVQWNPAECPACHARFR
jgi:hypothetical protein